MRILSIDPGTNFIGISIIDVLGYEHRFAKQVQSCSSVNIEVLANTLYGETIVPVHGLRQAKVFACKHLIFNLLMTWTPTVVVCESPYMGRFPQAFAALVECMQQIKTAVIEYDHNLPFVLYDPSTVKKAVGSKGINSDKSNVLNAMKLVLPEIDYTHLDEHAVDSLAVGYTYITKYFEHIS